jgi:uncharacterized protein YbjQ (UPF0145 family)
MLALKMLFWILERSKESILVVTTPTVIGYEIVKFLVPVHGLTVRTRDVGVKIGACIEGIFGGEVFYSSEYEKARKESVDRLVENARLGTNAVVGADFETSDILQGTATIFSAYVTAVIIKPVQNAVLSSKAPPILFQNLF